MEFNEYNLEITKKYLRPPNITINRSGLFRFNTMACSKINITTGDRISFYQDKSDLKRWLIAIDSNGFRLNNTSSNKKHGLEFFNKVLAREIINSVNPDLVSSANIGIGEQINISEKTYIELITQKMIKI